MTKQEIERWHLEFIQLEDARFGLSFAERILLNAHVEFFINREAVEEATVEARG